MRRHFTFLILLWACLSGTRTQADTFDKVQYYAAAEGKKQAALKQAMYEIIRHANTLSYGSGAGATWSGFYQTDRLADGECRDRYSYEHHYFKSSTSAVSGMNIEHSFPKSWWGGGKNQAYEDIHHLMPSESTINSRKSNYGMGVVTDQSYTNGCTKIGKGPGSGGSTINLWEPADEWKGDFARAVFYMVTCYQNLTWSGSEALKSLDNNAWPTLKSWAYTLYLKWNREDPVDDMERTRNDKVYEIQGNRNPYIDFPYLADYIWGDSTAVAFKVNGQPHEEEEDTIPTPPPAPGDTTLVRQYDFAQGHWRSVDETGYSSQVWQCGDDGIMTANAYSLGGEAEAFLVSPTLDLSRASRAWIVFDHAVGLNSGTDVSKRFMVWASSDYNQEPYEANWTDLQPAWPTYKYKNGMTDFVSSGQLSLDDFCGETVNVAFRYTSTTQQCWSWQVRDFTLYTVQSITGLEDNAFSPVPGDKVVFDMNGVFVGRDLPTRPGMYVVREQGYTYKVWKR